MNKYIKIFLISICFSNIIKCETISKKVKILNHLKRTVCTLSAIQSGFASFHAFKKVLDGDNILNSRNNNFLHKNCMTVYAFASGYVTYLLITKAIE